MDSPNPSKQNEVWSGVNSKVDLKNRIPEIVKEISTKCDFVPNKLLSTSSWWSENTGVGAFHFNGKFNGMPVVLKVQGVKPTTSETFMIESFAKQNSSNVIRPPQIFAKFPWNEKVGYEAFILEDVGTDLVVHIPATKDQISNFFDFYNEYRKNCINTPWLEKPNIDLRKIIKERFSQWTLTSHRIFPNHPFRKPEDNKLIDRSIEILTKNDDWLNLEFVHGHFSASDLFRVDKQIVVLSNLYWSWRTPYYDLVFGYHWFMYGLGSAKNITPEKAEEQRKIWMNNIEAIAKDKILLKYALLERATAGLALDALSVDAQKPITKHLVEKTREITKSLIAELS